MCSIHARVRPCCECTECIGLCAILYWLCVCVLCMYEYLCCCCWLCVCMPIVVCCCCCVFAVTHTFFYVIQSSLLLMFNETSMSVDRALQCLYTHIHTYTTHIINKTDPIVCFVFIILLSFYLSIYLSISLCRSRHTKFIRFSPFSLRCVYC